MHASNAEIETLTCKAAVGVGLPAGLAEDAGVAAAWLSGAGFAGADIACRAIENIRKGRARPVIISGHTASLCPDTKGKLASVMYAAPSLFDFLQTTSRVTVARAVVAVRPSGVFEFCTSNGTRLALGWVDWQGLAGRDPKGARQIGRATLFRTGGEERI